LEIVRALMLDRTGEIIIKSDMVGVV
jgi:hypothetical protein